MRLLPLSVLLLLSGISPLAAQTVASVAAGPSGVLKLDTVRVTGSRLGAATDMGAEPTEVYDQHELEESGAFNLEEFFGRLAPSPVGNEQLVLIDGQPTYMDISKLPPGMVASIEVSNYGALSQYGAYANGRVINIRLKTNYHGESVDLDFRNAFDGGGSRREVSLSGGVTRNKWRLIYNVNYEKQAALLASDRSFSRNQDHTTLGGQDLRLPWGAAAVVQSVFGDLTGIVNANGQPTTVALAPENQDGRSLTPAGFLRAQVFPPATQATAAGQRRFNTSGYLTLVAPAEEKSFNFNLSRPLNPRVEASVSGSVSFKSGLRGLAPPVTAVSAATLVPAAYNPFGQDIEVGLVHTGFGPVRQRDDGTNAQLGFNLNGKISETWRWNLGLGSRWSRSTQTVTDLDREKFAAALAAIDPGLRFNPFGDDPHNAVLYPQLAVDRSSAADSTNSRLDLSSSGEPFHLPGGPMRLMVRGNYSDQVQSRKYENAADFAAMETHRHANSYGLTAVATLPWFDKPNARPGLRHLETTVSGSYADRSSSRGGTMSGRVGTAWSPQAALSLHLNYAVTLQAPVHFVADLQPLVGETLIDPRRSPTTATDVILVAQDFDGRVRSRNDLLLLGGYFEPKQLPGLQLSVNYDRRQQHHLSTGSFKAQDLIYNELTFPGRVTRAAPAPGDLLLGQPGRILGIDTTPTDGAEQSSSGVSLSLRYRRPSPRFGQFRFSVSVRHPLNRRYEISPGVRFVFESENQFNPPDWTGQGEIGWNRNGWQASANVRYVSGVTSGSLVQPATTDLDVRAGYRFRRAVWGRWGKGLQVAVGLGNLAAGAPPYADTLSGFRTGSALGRTYALTVRLPLGAEPE